MANRKQLIDSSITYIDGTGNVLKMSVVLAGNSELDEVKALLETSVFTLDDDAYIQDNVMSTRLYDLASSTHTLRHIEKSSDPKTSNCILCAVEQYLLKSYTTFIEEFDANALRASTLFGLDAVPVTLVLETENDWSARLYYINADTGPDSLSLYVHKNDLTHTDILQFISDHYRASVVSATTVLLHTGKS